MWNGVCVPVCVWQRRGCVGCTVYVCVMHAWVQPRMLVRRLGWTALCVACQKQWQQAKCLNGGVTEVKNTHEDAGPVCITYSLLRWTCTGWVKGGEFGPDNATQEKENKKGYREGWWRLVKVKETHGWPSSAVVLLLTHSNWASPHLLPTFTVHSQI